MKIALFVPSWPPGFLANGIVTYAAYLVPALRQLGHTVFIITPQKFSDENDPYTIELPKRGLPLWDRIMYRLAPDATTFGSMATLIADAVRKLHEEQQLDVYETEESFGWSDAVSQLNLLPVVVRLHGPWFLVARYEDAQQQPALVRTRVNREGKAIKSAHFVTSPSTYVLEATDERYQLGDARFRVISNPIKVAPESEVWSAVPHKHPNFLFVGRFDTRKGGDFVVRAFAQLATSYPDVSLSAIGPDKGVNLNGKQVQFEDFVRGNVPEQLRARIRFMGTMSHSDTMAVRKQFLATIVASQFEIAPYSVLEAMSLGCPLVTTAVGGIPEMIRDKKNGLLVASQDVTALAAACRTLIEHPNLAASLGRRAWEDCRAYEPENIARQTVAAYQEAIRIFRPRTGRL